MRAPFLALFITLLVNIIVDVYIYLQSRRRCHSPLWSQIQLISAIIFTAAMVVEICLPARKGGEMQLLWKMWLLFAYLSVYIAKYVALVFDFISCLPRIWKSRRWKAVTKTGIVLGCITFAAMWWGALINRFRINVENIEVEITGLPQAFEGLRIVQFSDLHTGTFSTDTTFVSRIVDEINALNADVIVFTGDIVNRRSVEMTPFVSPLSRLHAPMGVYAILGNHDYGDYNTWPSESDRQANMQRLFTLYDLSGMTLLRNQTAWLHAGNDSIALIGVENIGDPPFKTYGSLPTAYPTPGDSCIKILLSHNPQHWVDSISDRKDINIPLTLSGHTHAMQIETWGISPAALRYKTWGGMYADKNNRSKLYVNIGAGTVGLPMRVGATPELTVFTLKPASGPNNLQ